MTDEIRQTVAVDGRTLHLRRSGSGPAVVLLHESPRSSAVLVPLARRLAADFTVFALDSPGFGQSDPLPVARPTIHDFADAVVASLRALGLTRAPVYGTHTGACIAMAIARRHPDFASGAVLDGYPVFTAEEQDSYAYQYFVQFEPVWDGQHVVKLWSRVRDQYTFFPWYALGRGSRILRDPPAPEAQTGVIRDFLASGSAYARGYEAAFRMDAFAELDGTTVPVRFLCREDDLLYPHLDRLPPLPATMAIERLGPDRQVLADRIAAIFAGMVSDGAPAPVFTAEGPQGGALRALAPGLLARCYGAATGNVPPLVLLPDLPGSPSDWGALALREASRRQVIAIHLPGCGVSPPPAGAAAADPDTVVDTILDGLAARGITRFDLAGRGAGALLALRLAARRPGATGRVVLVDPPALDAAGPITPDPVTTPDWHAGHLLAAWFEARDRMLYRPWHRRQAAAARLFGPGVDVQAVHATFRARMLAEGRDVALEQRLLAEAPSLAPGALTGCPVVLRQGDPDNASLGEALAVAGASVAVAHYDDLAEFTAAALRAG